MTIRDRLLKSGRRSAINARVRSRTQEIRRCECVICGEFFVDAETVHRHTMMMHTDGERPHKCSVCNKSFLFVEQCKEHQAKVHDFKEPAYRDFIYGVAGPASTGGANSTTGGAVEKANSTVGLSATGKQYLDRFMGR